MSDTPAVTSLSWLPSRKVLAGGIGGLAAFGLLTGAKHFGYDAQAVAGPYLDALFPPPGTVNVIGLLSTAITAGIAYLVPPSAKDIVNHLNDDIVAMAQNDPKSPVTAAGKSNVVAH